jgi:predicted PurR-regulated permease PerM
MNAQGNGGSAADHDPQQRQVADEAEGASADAATVPAPRSRDRLLLVITVLLVLYACSVAEIVLVPLVVALLFGLMLSPVVRVLERWYVPRVIGTLLVLALLIGAAAMAFAGLASPARDWVARMPRALDRMETALHDLRRPFNAATRATEQIEKMTGANDGTRTLRVVDAGSGLLHSMLNALPAIMASTVEALFLTFLFVLHGDSLMRKFVALAPHLRAKRELVIATHQAQRDLSAYVITITLINAALGTATAAALWLLGVPDPLLWGAIAALLNYAPYVGPLVTAAILTVVGFAQFTDPWAALAVPGVSLGLHVLEGELITPHLVGRRLKLDPVMVFIALILLGWLWGVAGLLLAVPLMTCAKLIAERTPEGEPLARLLSV